MKIKELRRRKEELIQTYLSLQDKADKLNDEIYQITCQIETLNLMIDQEEKRQRQRKQQEQQQQQQQQHEGAPSGAASKGAPAQN